MIYIEYIRRKPTASLEEFHRIAKRMQEAWAQDQQSDQLLLNLARTWRVGPLPPYLCIWHAPGFGIEKLDEWERLFASGRVDHIEDPINLVIEIEQAGCYRPLVEPLQGTRGPFYIEFLERAAEGDTGDVAHYFEGRALANAELSLHLLAERIGLLGPDPPLLAVWGADSYGALAQIVEERLPDDAPIRPVTAGLYSSLGDEIL